MTTAETEIHELAHVEVTTHGARAVCACGWASHRSVDESIASRRTVEERWYEHFVREARARAR